MSASALRLEALAAKAEESAASQPAAAPAASEPAAEPLRVICCYCPDFDRADPINEGATHGICPACFSRADADPAWKGGR